MPLKMEKISRVQVPRGHVSRVQVTSSPESKRREFKRPIVHSPAFRVCPIKGMC